MNEQRIATETADFRTYEPFTAKNAEGATIWMQLCEELDPESGRWEAFYATYRNRPASE